MQLWIMYITQLNPLHKQSAALEGALLSDLNVTNMRIGKEQIPSFGGA